MEKGSSCSNALSPCVVLKSGFLLGLASEEVLYYGLGTVCLAKAPHVWKEIGEWGSLVNLLLEGGTWSEMVHWGM